jgi:PAS domain S-box-containing protein
MGFLAPANAYLLLDRITPHLDRSGIYRTRKIVSNKVEITFKPNPQVKQKPYQCENRLGTFDAVGKFFLNRFPHIEHPECIHQGGDCCRYIISWDEPPQLTWRRVLRYALAFLPVACLIFYFLLPEPLWEFASLSAGLILLSVAFYSQYLEKKEILNQLEKHTDTAKLLLEQINMRYNSALLIQEVGQATSMTTGTEKVLFSVMGSFEKHLDFDRGMIMLANKEKTKLVYRAGYGQNLELKELLEKITFNLTNPQSRGFAVRAFKEQKPFIVNDIEEALATSSPKSIDFAKKMGTQAFICVPIVFEKESLGVIFVDNIHSKRRFDQSDVSLLMGIAPQIAINLYNAMSYQRIRESEEKFRSLSENAPDIICTLNINGNFTYINPAWEALLGYRIDDAIGMPFGSFIRYENNDYPPAGIFERLRDNKQAIRDKIVTITQQTGENCYFSMSIAPNFGADESVVGFAAILKDITDLKHAEQQLKQSYDKLQNTLNATIETLSKISAVRDAYTASHQIRVAELARSIARKMQLPERQIEGIYMAAVIHDMGKINIPSEILSNPRKLTPIEFELIKTHPTVGYDILKQIEFAWPVALIVLQHHERMNGSGYPSGLKGNDILMESRIISVADVVEAMMSHRPYRPALGLQKAMEEISQSKETLYDKQVVDACLELLKEGKFPLQ